MSAETIAIIASIVALAIAVYAIYKAHQAGEPITGELLTSTVHESTVLASELMDAGLTAARAAQQLFESGKITRDERLDKAFGYVKKWFPDMDQERIIMAIEAGVQVVNQVSEMVTKNADNG